MYIPYKKIVLTSSLQLTEVVERVSESIQKPEFCWNYPKPTPPFIGKINNNEFLVCRAIQYKNGFLPNIIGKIYQNENHTEISLIMVLPLTAILFIFLYFLGCIYAEFRIISGMISDRIEPNNTPFYIPLIPLGMMLFLYLLTNIAFHIEVKKAERGFKEIIT